MEAVYMEQWGLWSVRAQGREVFVKTRSESEAIALAARRMEAGDA